MKNIFRFRLVLLSMLLLTLLVGCNSLRDTSLETGSLKLTFSSPNQSESLITPQTVSDYIFISKFVVTATRNTTVLTYEYSYTGGSTQDVIINNLAVGEWKIDVVAVDINNHKCYGGNATVSVTTGVNSVVIPIFLLNGDLDVTVKLPLSQIAGLNITSGKVKLVNPVTGVHEIRDLTINLSDGFVDYGPIKSGTWYMEVELFDNGNPIAWGSGSLNVFPDQENHALIEFTDVIQGGDLKITIVINESPSDPTGLTGVYQNQSIVLNWNANPETNIAGYVVYRATSETGFKKILTYSLITSTTYTDTDVQTGENYYYWVQAYDTYGYSSEFSAACYVSANVSTTSPIAIDLTQYSSVLYVDGVVGDDTTGNGSITAPYKTVTKASENITSTNTAVYIVEVGSYAIPNGLQSLLKANLQVDYIVSPEKFGSVVFDLQNVAYVNSIQMTNYNNFIGIVFRRSLNTTNTTCYEYFYNAGLPKINFQNCVFDAGSITPSHSPIVINQNTTATNGAKEIYYNNCTFIPNFTYIDDYSIQIHGFYTNCAFTTANYTTDSFNLSSATFDSLYNITSLGWQNSGTGTNPDGTQANIGVYGGTYGWGLW